MRRLALFGVVLSLLAAVHAQTTPKKDPEPTFTREILRQYWEAWSTLDPANAERFYDQSPANVYFDLAPLKYTGWEEYKKGVVAVLAGFQSGKVTLNDAQIHAAGAMAWTTSTARMDMVNKDGSTSVMDVRHTAIWHRKQGKWLIVHEHVSAPLPPAQP